MRPFIKMIMAQSFSQSPESLLAASRLVQQRQLVFWEQPVLLAQQLVHPLAQQLAQLHQQQAHSFLYPCGSGRSPEHRLCGSAPLASDIVHCLHNLLALILYTLNPQHWRVATRMP